MDDRVDNNGGVRDGKQLSVDHRRMDEQIGGDEMKSMILIMSRREAEKRLRAKKRQMMIRQAIKYLARIATLVCGFWGVFAITVPYSTMGVAGVLAALAMIPMMYGMEDME